jgi:hypothetical protein
MWLKRRVEREPLVVAQFVSIFMIEVTLHLTVS